MGNPPPIETLSLLPVGLHVVTACADDGPAGLLCGWVTQASWDPPLVVVAVGRSKHTHAAIARGGAYAINLLRPNQLEIAKLFGMKSGCDVDKFASVSWRPAVTGSPVLDGVAGYLDCRVTDRHDVGDHTLFVGEIVAAEAFASECLLYQRDRHQREFAP